MPIIKNTFNENEMLKAIPKARANLNEVFKVVLEEARKQTPYDEGNLRASVDTLDASTGGEINIQIGILSPVSYGAKVHEDPKARHEPPTKWKFIEDPFNKYLPAMRDAIVRALPT